MGGKPVFSKTTERLLLVAKLSEDRLKLFIDVSKITPPAPPAPDPDPAEGEEASTSAPVPPPADPFLAVPVTGDEILVILKEFMDLQYVNTDVLEDVAKALNRNEEVIDRRVVKGVEPENGGDGKILFLVKRLSGEVDIKVDDKGIADLRALHLFDNISQGTAVARIYPPKNGIEGRDALGKPIAAKAGKPFKISLDKTLSLNPPPTPQENYQVVTAEVDGYLCEDSGRLSIKGELLVKGNLDYHTGTIDFVGSVLIKGDVLPDFSVRARKGIVVQGACREASLICERGDIIVRGHAYGGKGGRIVSGGNFECAVAQEIEVEASGNIVIHKEATQCALRTQASVLMEKGTLMGGKVLAVCGVDAKEIGNEVSQSTEIRLCSDVEMTAEYTALVTNIENHERAIKMVDLHLGPFSANPARVQNLKGPFRVKMEKLFRKKEEIFRGLALLKHKREELLRGAHHNPVVRVNFHETMFPGTVVRVNEGEFAPKEPLKGPGSLDYTAETGTFAVGELKALECSIKNQSGGNS